MNPVTNDSLSANLVDRITIILLEKKELEIRLNESSHPDGDIRKVVHCKIECMTFIFQFSDDLGSFKVAFTIRNTEFDLDVRLILFGHFSDYFFFYEIEES